MRRHGWQLWHRFGAGRQRHVALRTATSTAFVHTASRRPHGPAHHGVALAASPQPLHCCVAQADNGHVLPATRCFQRPLLPKNVRLQQGRRGGATFGNQKRHHNLDRTDCTCQRRPRFREPKRYPFLGPRNETKTIRLAQNPPRNRGRAARPLVGPISLRVI